MGGMADFLKLRGQTWWFRRRIPAGTVPFHLGTYIAKSVRTTDRRVGVIRARQAWVQSEELLQAMNTPDLSTDQARLLLRRFAQEDPWNPAPDLRRVYARAAAGDARDADDLLTVARPDLLSLPRDDRARALLHVRNLLDALDLHGQEQVAALVGDEKPSDAQAFGLVVAHARHATESYGRAKNFRAVLAEAAERQADAAPPVTVASLAEDYLAERSRKTRDSAALTGNALYQLRLTYRLWTEAMGDIPMAAVSGREAGRFRDLLLRLPASHGKARGRTPTVPEAVTIADAKEAQGVAVPRLTLKTAKRHFSSMLGLWRWAKRRDYVTSLPFAGFEFAGTRANRQARDEWSEADLLSLLRSDHMRRAAASRSRDWWLVSLGMFAGLRIEEACRLRSEDVVTVGDMPCVAIRAQEGEGGWTPKSAAGVRLVPLHPALLDAGIPALAGERRGEDRLIPGLVPSGPQGQYGAAPSREFSRLKVKLGVSPATTFHSFRHSLSTIIRNRNATIRESWVDALLGHEGRDDRTDEDKASRAKSVGDTVYRKRIHLENLALTVRAIEYPEPVMAAFLDLAERSRAA